MDSILDLAWRPSSDGNLVIVNQITLYNFSINKENNIVLRHGLIRTDHCILVQNNSQMADHHFPKALHCNEMIEPGVVVQRALSGGSREGWAVFKFPALPRLWLAQQGGARDRLAQGVSHLRWQGLAQQLLHLALLSLSISSLLLAPASAQCAKKENETKTRNNMSCTLPKNLF